MDNQNNHMAEVAKILGVELEEVFRIGNNDVEPVTFYKFTRTRFLQSKDGKWWTCGRAVILFSLLTGYWPVIKMEQRR